MDDLISRQAAIDSVRAGVLSTATLYGRTEEGETARKEIERTIKALPSVNPQASKEDIHREREQAYMKGYEDASKRYRTEPCEDVISRSDAIRVASGYCHWSNIPDELAKLPSVNPKPCEDAISRQEVLEGLARIAKAKARSDAQKAMMGRAMFFVERMPSVSTEKTGWIPVERELPELNRPLWVTAYHRVCYAHMISKSGNYGYPVFRLHELKDNDRGWVQETISHEPYSKGRIDAWMYIDIPQPYKAESEDEK